MNGQSLPDLSLGFSKAQLNSSEAGGQTHTEKTARAGGLTSGTRRETAADSLSVTQNSNSAESW